MQTIRSDESGSAYVITMFVMAITLVMGMSLMTTGMTELDISGNYRNKATAYFAAESGIEMTLVDLRNDTGWIDEMLTPSLALENPFPSSVTINGTTIALQTSGGVVVPGYYAYGSAQTVSGGNYTREIYLPPTVTTAGGSSAVSFRTRSTGTGGIGDAAEQVVRADVTLTVGRGHGVWDNAIFANSGQGGNLINGHVAIRGSVHVIGDENNPPDIEFSGSADLRNNYADAVDWFGATDAAKLPALGTTTFNGETVESLNAVVRMKHANVVLNGNADIGLADATGNAVKETVDAIRTGGTVTANAGSSVNTDETVAYDTPNVAFPTLDDPYNDGTTTWTHHRDYLDSSSLHLNIPEISRNIDSFSYSDGNGNSLTWDKDALTLAISGIVRINGSIRLGRPHGQPGLRGLYVQGTGTIYATSDVHVDGWVVPENDYINSGDNLGLIADSNVYIDEASHINVFAAIYAEETTTVSKQTTVAGALVANYFDMGTNVPAVFQVPSLADNLPPGMPGAGSGIGIVGVAVANWYQES